MGRVITNWQCTPRTCGTSAYLLSYLYDLAGNMISNSNGVGVTFSSTYNTALRLTGVTSNLVDAQHPAVLLSNAHYNAFGLSSDVLGNGLNENVGYTSRGMMQSYSSTPYSFTLTGISGNGAITAANDSVNGNWTYTYDPFNRLLSSNKTSSPTQGFGYSYDRYGNRWQQNLTAGGTGPQPQYTFDTTTNRISGSGVIYDALGNVINDGAGSTYTYDAENRQIQLGGNVSAAYTFDADGRRIRNSSTEFLYDLSGHAVTLLAASTGGWMYGEIYTAGRHLATYSGATTNFLHTDWLGTKRAMSNLSAATSETCTNLPFGDGAGCIGTDWNFNHFTDDVHDSEDNLEHTWFRQLSTAQGRWMRPDPYSGSMDLGNPQTLNRYAYVINNPLRLVDPLGLDEDGVGSSPCDDWDKTCFATTEDPATADSNLWSCGLECLGIDVNEKILEWPNPSIDWSSLQLSPLGSLGLGGIGGSGAPSTPNPGGPKNVPGPKTVVGICTPTGPQMVRFGGCNVVCTGIRSYPSDTTTLNLGIGHISTEDINRTCGQLTFCPAIMLVEYEVGNPKGAKVFSCSKMVPNPIF